MDSSGSRSRYDKEKEEDEKEMLERLEQWRGYVQAWSLRPLNQPSVHHRLAQYHERQKIALQLRAQAIRDRGGNKDPDPTSKQEMQKDSTTNAEEPSGNAPDREATRNAEEDDNGAQQKNKNPPNE